jgi:hypothetical protein
VLVAGGVTFGVGVVAYAVVVTTQPEYLLHWLPASLLVGLGVALTFPVLSAAAVAGLPVTQFGVGGAINQTARQLGAVLGVALLVAIIGTPTSTAQALAHFDRAWLMAAGAAFLSAAISAFQPRPVAAPATELLPVVEGAAA